MKRVLILDGTGRLGQAVLVPVGQAQLVPTGTGKGQKRPLLVPWDKLYTHAGGLSLSRDNLYTHDGTCPSSTCPNLSHKVGLQVRETFQSHRTVLDSHETIPSTTWTSRGCRSHPMKMCRI